jgi:hypothetical protein
MLVLRTAKYSVDDELTPGSSNSDTGMLDSRGNSLTFLCQQMCRTRNLPHDYHAR